jgi:hypothetical protein
MDAPSRRDFPESSPRVGAVLAIGGVTLAAAFLVHHRDDLARAATAVGGLASFVAHHGVARLAGAVASAAGAAIAALIVLAWYGAGTLLLRRSSRPDAGAAVGVLAAARATAFGAGLWSLVWFGLGLAGLYTTLTAAVALGLGVALAALGLRRCRTAERARPRAAAAGRAPAVAAGTIVVLALGAALVAALAPPTAKDTLQYHMALPKIFADAGALVAVPHNIPSHFPLGTEMHGLWAMLLGRGLDPRVGEAAFGATLFAFFPLLLAVVYGWARQSGAERPWALAAVALVGSVPTVYDVAASAYVDLALAVYVALAIEATARWWGAADARHLGHVALAIGFALAVKLLAVFPLLLVALVLLLRILVARGGATPARLAIGAGAALAAGVALGLPWYVRTWAATGSPLFPFFLEVWPASIDGWDVERSVMLGASITQYGPADPVLSLMTPVLASFTGYREVPALYEGVLGPAFLAGLLPIAWALRRRLLDTGLVITAAAGVAIVVWWVLSAQLLRYVLPALGPLAVAVAGAAACLARTGVPGLMPAVLAPAAASLLLALSWFVADAPMLPVLGSEARAEYLGRRLDYYPYYRIVNDTLPPDARVWLINMRRDTYHLERAYFSDYFAEDHTLRRWVETSTSAVELQARARRLGITHVLVRHDVLLDYGRSVLVDDARPLAQNVARLNLARSFLVDGTTVLRVDRKFLLAALPPAR